VVIRRNNERHSNGVIRIEFKKYSVPKKQSKRSKPQTYEKPPQVTPFNNYQLSYPLKSNRLLGVEDTSNTLANNSLILVGTSTASGNLGKNVIGSKHTSRPAGPAKVDVRVGHEVVEDVADGGQARLVVGTTGLGEDGLATVGAEPAGKLGEAGNVVRGGDTGRVGSRVVRVRVLVNVEDEVGLAAVKVGDLVQSSGRTIIDEV
jgi:hypothetical protein